MNDINISRHGARRMRKRLGIKKKSVDRMAEKALTYGVTHAEAKGSLSRYMDGLYLSHGTANNMRVYNRRVYLFRGMSLITVINLPNKYIEIADKLQRQKADHAVQPVHAMPEATTCFPETVAL